MKKMLLMAIVVLMTALQVSAQYKVGDVYNENGVKGMVCYVDESGQHGLIMSFNAAQKNAAHWAKDKDFAEANSPKCFDEDDGLNNMKKLEEFISKKGLSWSDFPLFEWARSLGEGWYIPAKNELQKLGKGLNGGSLNDFNAKNYKDYEKTIKKNKGDGMFNNGRFYMMLSSTEAAVGVYAMMMAESNGSALKTLAIGGYAKGDLMVGPGGSKYIKMQAITFQSRAVHTF